MPRSGDEQARRSYAHDGADQAPVVLGALEAAGRDIDQISIDDLAGIDEFHAPGRPATMALAEPAGVAAGSKVIDIGAPRGRRAAGALSTSAIRRA